ncbi:MFS transporter [Actinomadura sp. CNU-125]|uniref:MFS transporter n=1 Tax=Actinomadura sp. CNU-125 TaxID=1904961 RepID=UPI0021CC9EC5|nr:MFS transporter [Actinomadura sp. CNU-125]
MAARHRGLALALLTSVQFVLVLDASIVNIALPSIGRDLHFDQADLSWVANAYTLAFGGFLLFGGRVADLAGRAGCSSPGSRCSPPRRSRRLGAERRDARRRAGGAGASAPPSPRPPHWR